MKCSSLVSPTSLHLPLEHLHPPTGRSATSLAVKHAARSSSTRLAWNTAPDLRLPQVQSPASSSLQTLVRQPGHDLDSNFLGRTSLWFAEILFSTKLCCYCNCSSRCQPLTARGILLLSTVHLTFYKCPLPQGRDNSKLPATQLPWWWYWHSFYQLTVAMLLTIFNSSKKFNIPTAASRQLAVLSPHCLLKSMAGIYIAL